MKSNNVIEKIKDVLNLNEEVKLEQQALDNGTVLEADAFEADNEVFIVTEDERVALPVGEYQLEDGRILVVAEEGIISEVKEAGEEEVEEVEAEEEEKEEMAYATKEELAEVKEMIEEIKAMLEPKEDLSSEDLGNLITEELSKHELSEVPQEVQEELNEPAAEPIMANPEADSTNKPSFKFAQNRKPSTLDRVLNKIINN
jgi:membrane-associated HD superfamily phosphohydrolase